MRPSLLLSHQRLKANDFRAASAVFFLHFLCFGLMSQEDPVGHDINKWIQRLLVPGFAVAPMVLLHLGFRIWRVLAILSPIFAALMLTMIVLDPGPRAKPLIDGLKSRFR